MPERPRSEVVDEFLRERYRPILLGIIGFGAVLRLLVHVALGSADPVFATPSLDSQAFLGWAREIAAGDLVGEKVFFLNPLYPYFLAPIVKVFGPSPLTAVRIVQMGLGLAVVPLLAGATRRLLGEGIALGAALLAAAWPLELYYEQYLMIVTLAIFLNTLALYLLARIPERPTLGRCFLAGLPLGLAVLARPNVGLFAVLLPLWLLRLGPPGRRIRFAAGRTALLAAGAALMVLPVTIRNLAIEDGDFVLVTSSGGVNLYNSNNPRSWTTGRMNSEELRPNPALIETDARNQAESDAGRALTPSEVSAYWTARTFSVARQHPGAAVLHLGRKLLMFFRGDEMPSSYHFAIQRRETPVLGWIPLGWGILSPFMLLGLLLVFLRRREALPFALLYVAYAVGLAIFFPLAHYRAPVLPGALPLGALGVAAIAAPLLDRRWRNLALVLPAAVATCVLAFAGPLGSAAGVKVFSETADDEVVFWFNRGLYLLTGGDAKAGEEAFRNAMRADEKSWLPHRGLAMVARRRGDFAAERRHIEDGLALRPGDPGLTILLARNLFDTGRRQEGFELADEALRRAPGDGEVLTGLAGMCAQAGRYEDAAELFRRAEGTGLDDTSLIVDQCRMLDAAGRPEAALRRAERGLSLSPGHGDLLFEKALALLYLGAPEAEVADVARAAAATGAPPPRELLRFLPGGGPR